MAVPTPDFNEGFNNAAEWTFGGSLELIDDLWNPKAAGNFDGINDTATAASSPSNDTDAAFTYSCWFEILNQTTSFDSRFGQQMSGGPTNGYIVAMRGSVSVNGLLEVEWSDVGGTLLSRSSTTFDDGILHHILASVTLAGGSSTAKIFVDGSEVAYSVQDSIGGSPVGFNSLGGAAVLEVSPTAAKVGGEVTRPKVWRSALSSAQALEEYNNELAAIGEGFISGLFKDASLLNDTMLFADNSMFNDATLFNN